MTEKFCAEFGANVAHPLKLGKSFEPKKSGGAVYNSIRYDFKPTSIDQEGMGTLEVKERNGVSVSLPHSDGVGQTIYKGNTETAPTKDCVLIIDHETGELTLERITNKIMVKKTRPEKREKGEVGHSLPEAKPEAANPYEVKPNPYEVKPNPYEVKPNPYEVKPHPPSSSKPREKPPRSSSSSGGKTAQAGAQGKRRSPAQPPHLVDSLSPMHSNKSSPASTSGRGAGSQYVDSLGRPLSSSSSSSDSDSDPDDPPAPKVPPPSREAPPSAPPSMPEGLGMPGDLEDLLSSRPNNPKPRTSRPAAPSLPPAPAPAPPRAAPGSMPVFGDLGDDLELSDSD